MIELLLKSKADPDATIGEGETALMTAARSGNPAAVKLLVQSGANVNAKDVSGITPVQWAISYDYKEIVKLLRLHGAQLSIHDAAMLGDLATTVAVTGW